MMAMFELRMKKVISLTNCPSCGEDVLRVIAPGTHARAYFDCGSVFVAEACEEIKAAVPCPRPATVAARALNAEVAAELAKAKSAEAA